MNYQALYRMFRPQSFDDVVGQEHVTRTLRNAIAKNKQSHAYIFSGPRGTGKTSIAKIFAKAINCEVRDDGEPCNECPICKGITQGTNSDVIEIDAASNNGVDEIRNIRDKVKYAPSESRYKVYIIDEVHMLTTGAFNALLKTLEEPPSHAIFILATTEPHKIPPTIISRAQRFDFKAINMNQIVDRLAHVATTQNIAYDEDALNFIAKVSEGGMRDALSIMDQAIAFGDDRLTLKDALDVTGSLDESDINTLFKYVVENNVHSAFEHYHHFISQGKEVNRLINDMIYFVRNTIMAKTTQQPFEFDALNQFDFDTLYKMIDVINDTLVSIRFSVNQNVHFEVLIVKISEMVKEVQSTGEVVVNHASSEGDEALLRRMEALESELKTIKSQGLPTQSSTKAKPTKRRGGRSTFSLEHIAKVLDKANKEDIALIRERWADVIQYAKDRDQKALVSLLQNSQPVAASEDKVLIQFEDEIHCEILKKDETKRHSVENVIKDIINKSIEVVGVPADKWMQVRKDYIDQRKQGRSQAASQSSTSASEEGDVVQKAREMFGESLVHLVDDET
ncbi:DNA polymerase III subunit gamma/tau [Staphylococcus felis]|uniref:DNA polymerase III subunit gamma/tau n=1 Tax=Staphylococcus felis TaxID=46127 RepID=UPI000E280719|nr:DNA polymerase III subunit gamma/tau [Staphylococcus felis]REI05573.1 DNA polymerase III subunit gamma/tau [Staphylococcus felis]